MLRNVPSILLVLACGLVPSGCQTFVADHCANNRGDSDCDAGMFCSACTLDNHGCVAELPEDSSCHHPGGVASDSSGGASDGPSTTTVTTTATDDADTTAGSTTSTDPDSTTNGPIPSCEEMGNTCIETVPEGFAGPFAWLTTKAGAPSGCVAPYDADAAVMTFTDLAAPAADCPCDCGLLTGASCGGGEVQRYTNSTCVGGAASTLALSNGCNPVVGSWAPSDYFRYNHSVIEGGGCDPQFSVETEPAQYSTTHTACTAALEQGQCETGELCAPTPDDPYPAQWCVWIEGDVECPADSMYTERFLTHRDIEDDRSCSLCECEVPDLECTGSTTQLVTETDCMGGLSAGNISNGACAQGLGALAIEAVSHNVGTLPTDTCNANTPTPTGQAVPTDPVTFCCTP